jgi:hypothetical protein
MHFVVVLVHLGPKINNIKKILIFIVTKILRKNFVETKNKKNVVGTSSGNFQWEGFFPSQIFSEKSIPLGYFIS